MQIPTEAQSRINSSSSSRPDQNQFAAESATDFLSIVDEALAPDPRSGRRRETRAAAEDARRAAEDSRHAAKEEIRERREDRDRDLETLAAAGASEVQPPDHSTVETPRDSELDSPDEAVEIEAPVESEAPVIETEAAPGAAAGESALRGSSLSSGAAESGAAVSSSLRDPFAAGGSAEGSDSQFEESEQAELEGAELSGDAAEDDNFSEGEAEGERLFDFGAAKKTPGPAGASDASAFSSASAAGHTSTSASSAGASTAQPTARGGEVAPLDAPARRDVAAAARSAPAARASLQAVEIDRVVEQIKLHTRPGISRIQMIIDPPELGRLSIRLSLRGDQLVGRVAVESAELLQQLREQLPALREAMNEAGVDVRDFEFTQEEPTGDKPGDADRRGVDDENGARRDARHARIYGESRRGAARLALGQRAVDDGLDVVV